MQYRFKRTQKTKQPQENHPVKRLWNISRNHWNHDNFWRAVVPLPAGSGGNRAGNPYVLQKLPKEKTDEMKESLS